ncbi:hypothetical protein DC74_972 [Streptomyces noursei]|nr:hypothetical protein DC74_972 [Streptomyces noursei]
MGFPSHKNPSSRIIATVNLNSCSHLHLHVYLESYDTG